jgi:hypothetical protein
MSIELLARGRIRHLFFFPTIARIELIPLGTTSTRNFLIYDDASTEIVSPLTIARRNWLIATLSRAFFEELALDVYGEITSADIPTISGVQFYAPSFQPGPALGGEVVPRATEREGPAVPVFESTAGVSDIFDPTTFGRR